jgi:hypothetical protein
MSTLNKPELQFSEHNFHLKLVSAESDPLLEYLLNTCKLYVYPYCGGVRFHLRLTEFIPLVWLFCVHYPLHFT